MSSTGTRRSEQPGDEGDKRRWPRPPKREPLPERELVDGGPFPAGARSGAEFPDVGVNGLAPTLVRAMARLTDFVLSIMIPQALALFAFGIRTESETGEELLSLPLWAIPLLIGVLAAYEIGTVAWKGATPGMLIGRITVKTLADGEDPTSRVAVRRAVFPLAVYALWFVLPPVGIVYLGIYLSPLLDRALRQGWCDKFAKTVVVRTR